MIELVLVIVVLGILAALALPRLDRDIRQEAADNILSAIRFTKLMALTDDKTDPSDNKWQQGFWRIDFYSGSNAYYTVGSDRGHDGSITKTETAIDPSSGKYFYSSNGDFSARAQDESPAVFIGHKYGIDTITPSGGCSNLYIGFDHMGRPYNSSFVSSATPDFSGRITRDCKLTFHFTGSGINDLAIVIEKQTGHAYIEGQPNS